MQRLSLMMSVCLLSLAACSTSTVGLGDKDRLVVTPLTELPYPRGINPDDQVRPYYLGPKDQISVNVYGEDTLGAPAVIIDGGGSIDMPVIGSVPAQGLTTYQLGRDIESRLQTILQKPDVSINILSPASQTLLVDGAIAKPGLYPVMGRRTLMQMVAEAGGTQEFAIVEKFVLMRKVEGKTYAAVYNLKDIRQGTREDPEVFAGDIVLVGNSSLRKLLRDVLQYTPFVYLIARSGR